ncbi:MAG TPA: ABC transporter permease, partial [Longimicrobiales bacterium]|nr:ABC transporter permease [Longimicrobiales bacterium]
MTLPRWVGLLVRALVPEEFAEDLLDDLGDGFQRRRIQGGGAWRWLGGELVRAPYVSLWREARRLRASGARREMSTRIGGGGMGLMGGGIRVAARSLLKRPSYTVVTVLTLVASIGSATLIFSVMEGVLLRPLPYEGGERVQRIFATNESWRDADQAVLRESWDRLDLTEDMVVALRGAIPGAEALGAYTKATLRIDDGLPPAQLPGAYVLDGLFETLPMSPVLGRLPTDEEAASGAPVVVLSERLWTSRYGRDPHILGRAVSLGGTSLTVIGVLPGAFAVPSESARWWSPLPDDFAGGRTDAAVFVGLVRLDPATEPATVAEAVARVGSALAESNAKYGTMGVRLRPLAELLVADVQEGITLLFWAVVAVVLIASVNLANLVVARGARRRGELAMRSALGASRVHLLWSMLSETVLTCAVGGGLGVLAATQLLGPFLALLTRA